MTDRRMQLELRERVELEREVESLREENARLREAVENVTYKAEQISNIYSADDCHILDEKKVFELLDLCEALQESSVQEAADG
jgi:uncharacterized protein YlxW (UPF0749 family)